MGLDDTTPSTGLSSLARALAAEQWPAHWREPGDARAAARRKTDLERAFGRLHQSLDQLWPGASFQVHKDAGRRDRHGPSRWVEIAPQRLRILV